MTLDEPAKIAAQCRHYAMCKIDYLGTGICPAAADKPYVAYYPQGRMDIYDALTKKLIPVTDALVDIAERCNLCAICDIQCHFVTELRPAKVMEALKAHVDRYLKRKGKVVKVREDAVLKGIRKIVGKEYATNDPAILVTYANDPFPLADMQMPRYVVLPATAREVADVVRLANKRGIRYVARGNGGSVFGFVFTDGIVIDTNRMKGIEIDPENWTVTVEAGVTSYELQQEVSRRGFRVNVAEPAATHVGNIVCTGIFSTWSASYGTAADNFVRAEFVDREGNIFSSNDRSAANVFVFRHNVIPSPGICTKAVVRMHPVTDDEEGLLVPFSSFDEAVFFARTLSMRRLGLAIGVLGAHYLSTFISPSARLADQAKAFLTDVLGIEYAVYVVGDRFARSAIRTLATVVIDQEMLTRIMLGLPRLLGHDVAQLVQGLEGTRPAYELLCKREAQPLLETMLSPSPETLAAAMDEDLRAWYERLYARPEMTNMVWLNSFRIVSARMSRHKHMFAFLVYVPLDRIDVIKQIIAGFERVADSFAIDHDYGFLTPIDLGKRAILEYDYYIDHTDESEREKIRKAMVELDPWLDRVTAEHKGVMSLKYVFAQGCSRKEHWLYLSIPRE